MKSFFRFIYRSIPFKRLFICLTRKLGLGKILPNRVKSYLVFEGYFSVAVDDKSFLMENGYGRDIESTLFWNGLNAFEGNTMYFWKILAKRSNVIIDVGANTGVYSLVAKTLNPEAVVFSFEPIERVFNILNINININKCKEWSTPIIANLMAVSDYCGKGQMYDLPVLHMYTASLNKDIHFERGNTIPTCKSETFVTRLDQFLALNKFSTIDLIKIDVESHEPFVLRGMGELLERCGPSMIIEIWDNVVGREVEEVLRHCDYLYYAILDSSVERRDHINNDFPERGYINYLVVTKKIAAELQLIS